MSAFIITFWHTLPFVTPCHNRDMTHDDAPADLRSGARPGCDTGLRQQKRRRNRANIIAAAIELARSDGLESVTVARIADRAEISVRTFFRFFSSKERAVAALEADFLATTTATLERSLDHGRLGHGRLGHCLAEAFGAAIEEFDSTWWKLFGLAAQLIEDSPTAKGAALDVCEAETARLAALLAPHFADRPAHEIDLTVEGIVGSWRVARRHWVGSDSWDPENLRARITQNLSVLERPSLLTAAR